MSYNSKYTGQEVEQLLDKVDDKADDSSVVHKTGNESITGAKTFNGGVNFLGSGDSNAVTLSTNTRINVNGTNKTVLGFGSSDFYINHGDYKLLLRGKDTRPTYNNADLALSSDVATKQDKLVSGTSIKTINGKSLLGSGNIQIEGGGGGGGASSELTKVTYAELKEMRDSGSLAVGHLYRITDYEFTTKQSNTKSAGNVFDIIVLATAENQLSELARAIQHEGDTYFDGNDLGAWELWYDLDNDTTKYEWADATNGKGVIYRMIDEKRNDCPYDFKNALFYNTKLITDTTSDKYYYTFSYVVNDKLYDGTVENQVKNCYGNNMGVYIESNKKTLNLNVFRCTGFVNSCSSNTFGDSCRSNTFGNGCYANTFGDSCRYNTFGNGCYANSFEDNCYVNSFNDNCYSNTFGNGCYANSFEDNCYVNSFKDSCYSNTFGSGCYANSFKGDCYFNTFGYFCSSNSFGSGCRYNHFKDYCHSNTFGNGCYNNTFGYVSYHELNSVRTSITLNDEYFDDGSGKLVPIKHPDLSTQPSILPYKFMGQYVYEQLIPITDDDDLYNIEINLLVDEPIFISAGIIANNGYNPAQIYGRGGNIFAFNTYAPSSAVLYAHIVYTSMPEEGDYYGYNNY